MNTATATEASENIVTVTPVEGDALYLKYRGESQPQSAYVTLDCESGELSAAASGIIGSGAPTNVWNNTARRWRIPALTESAANALLDEIAPLAERVVAGFERVWDGSNHVGEYDDDATAAIDEIASLCDRDWSDQTIEVWDAADWYGGVGGMDTQRRSLGITAETTDEEIATIEEREASDASPRIIEGLGRYLARLRDEAIESVDDDD